MRAVSASTSSPASSSGRPTPSRRRPPPGVRLRRGDLPTGRRQPWLVDYETSLAGLGLSEVGDAPLAVSLSVTTTGNGFFVRGRLTPPGGLLALPCEACGVPVPISLDSAFEVWLDPSEDAADGDGGDADVVPWPPHASSVDLTPAAAGAGKAALPGRVVCGAVACAVVEWVAGGGGEEGAAGVKGAATAAFGRLAGLRSRLEKQDGK